jgi:hypothetical protein
MYPGKSQVLLACFIFLFVFTSRSQTGSEYFSPLSTTAYVQRITVLKARPIRTAYEDKKEQKTYAEIIKDRNESILSDFENDRIVYDTLLLNKSQSIIQRIKAANKQFSFDSISVYINRSYVANASCYGEGTLFLNLGLFLWVDNDDELALVIGHELSHQFLNHSEAKIKKNIALFSSEEFISEMKAIKKSTNGKYERFKNLMKDVVTQNGTHSRYKESEADSLGVVLIRNAGYNVHNAALVLLKFDNVDDLFASGNVYNVKDAFEKTGADSFILKKNPRYNGLSMAAVTMNADKAFDSVKTHPDCIVRYKQLVPEKPEVPQTGCCKALSAPAMQYKERALVEMVRYAYECKRYTLCTHLCLFALQNNFRSSLYYSFLSLSFSGIYAAEKQLEKFSVTDMKATPGSTLKELQDFIFNANSTNIANMAAYFLNNIPSKTSEDYFFAEAMYNQAIKGADAAVVRQKFKTGFPDSKYNYLIKP